MWATEFGDATADELNLIEAGTNYGWPEIEGAGDGEPEFRDPVVAWRPSVASPAGVAFVDGRLVVAALRGERLWAVPLVGAEVGEPVPAFEDQIGRIRVVEVAPDGWLWLATSNRDGRGEVRAGDDVILRIPPLPAGG
jgi:glucose/arabinose dehydrogenase